MLAESGAIRYQTQSAFLPRMNFFVPGSRFTIPTSFKRSNHASSRSAIHGASPSPRYFSIPDVGTIPKSPSMNRSRCIGALESSRESATRRCWVKMRFANRSLKKSRSGHPAGRRSALRVHPVRVPSSSAPRRLRATPPRLHGGWHGGRHQGWLYQVGCRQGIQGSHT